MEQQLSSHDCCANAGNPMMFRCWLKKKSPLLANAWMTICPITRGTVSNWARKPSCQTASSSSASDTIAQMVLVVLLVSVAYAYICQVIKLLGCQKGSVGEGKDSGCSWTEGKETEKLLRYCIMKECVAMKRFEKTLSYKITMVPFRYALGSAAAN